MPSVHTPNVPPHALTFMRAHLLRQAERIRKEDAEAQRKAEDDAKKKSALTNMGSGYSGHLQKVTDQHGHTHVHTPRLFDFFHFSVF